MVQNSKFHELRNVEGLDYVMDLPSTEQDVENYMKFAKALKADDADIWVRRDLDYAGFDQLFLEINN